MPKPYFHDMASLAEDDRIEAIGRMATLHKQKCAFIVETKAKAYRYIKKMRAKFPDAVIGEIEPAPIKGLFSVSVNPQKNKMALTKINLGNHTFAQITDAGESITLTSELDGITHNKIILSGNAFTELLLIIGIGPRDLNEAESEARLRFIFESQQRPL